jgi:hypothetical protein
VRKKRLLRRRSCSSLSKRGLCLSGSLLQARFHLAGRGGEELKKSELVAAGFGGGPLELLEIWLSAVLHLRWRWEAVAILGHKSGRATLVAMVGTSFVFLCVRIFCRIWKPSGFVPGLEWGGAASTLQAAGGMLGLDCELVVLFRVFVVKVQGHVVFLVFLLGLSVKKYPPLK